MNRIVRLVALVLLGAAVCQPRPAAADADYPNRSIRLVVPYAPGGVPDTSARLLAQKLQARIGQSVFVENRPGGNGGVAAAVINTSPADGYTLMVVDTTLLSVGPIFLNDLSFDPKKDFVPIAALARTPLFLAVNAQTPIKTLDEFVAYVRAHPGQLNYGSAGVGSTHQLTMEAMKAALHLDIVHVPYHGTGEAVPALLGNHVQALWAAYPSLKGAVERGDIRLLAHNGLGHSPLLPELPPLSDLVPGFDMVTNIGVYPQERQAVSLLHLHRRHPTGSSPSPIRRVPAAQIEDAVIAQIRAMVQTPEIIVATWRAARKTLKGLTERQVRDELSRFDALWSELFPAEQARLVQLLVDRVDISAKGVEITLRVEGLTGLVQELHTAAGEQRPAA